MIDVVKVPRIRFKGFNDPWEQRELGDCLSLLRDGTHGTHADADEGPFLLSAKNIKDGELIINFENERKISWNDFNIIHSSFSLAPGDVLMTIVGTIGESTILKSAGQLTFQRSVAYLRPNENSASSFLCSTIGTKEFKRQLEERKSVSAQPGVYLGDLKTINIFLPAREEQLRIGAFFSRLNDLIALHQRKHNKLCTVKKSLLEKMFPKPGKLEPEIRFEGFTDPWEQRKLGDFAVKRVEKNTGGVITETFTNSAERGVVSQLDFFDHEVANAENVENYTIVEKNDFVYNPRISAAAPVGPINRCRLARTGVMSPLYTVFRTDETVDQLYLEHYFKTDAWHPFMRLEGNSGARSDRFSIGDKTFFEMPVTCPSIKEQRQIASAMESLDNLITLHQRKLELLRNIKKALLDGMFV